jgi:hypothetical protein
MTTTDIGTLDRLYNSDEPLCQGMVDAFGVIDALRMTASIIDACGEGTVCPCTRGERCWFRPAPTSRSFRLDCRGLEMDDVRERFAVVQHLYGDRLLSYTIEVES